MHTFICGILAIVFAAVAVLAQTGPQQQRHHHDLTGGNDGAPGTSDEPMLVRSLGIVLTSSPEGIVISEVLVSMPAFAAGLCVGDILQAVNRQPVTSVEQAIDMTRNIQDRFVMVELQRRDMHISRRVDVADGHAESIGMARDGNTVAVTFRRLASAGTNQIRAFARALATEVPDTLVLDLRNNPAGSADAAQQIARALSSLLSTSRNEHGAMQLVLLRPDELNAVATGLADALNRDGTSIILTATNAPLIRRDASGSQAGNTPLVHQDRPFRSVSITAQAPVHWSIAEFRALYPAPDRKAMQHPLMAYAPGIAPLAWGINGTAWEALNIARSML